MSVVNALRVSALGVVGAAVKEVPVVAVCPDNQGAGAAGAPALVAEGGGFIDEREKVPIAVLLVDHLVKEDGGRGLQTDD